MILWWFGPGLGDRRPRRCWAKFILLLVIRHRISGKWEPPFSAGSSLFVVRIGSVHGQYWERIVDGVGRVRMREHTVAAERPVAAGDGLLPRGAAWRWWWLGTRRLRWRCLWGRTCLMVGRQVVDISRHPWIHTVTLPRCHRVGWQVVVHRQLKQTPMSGKKR